MATKESELTGLEPRSFRWHFETLTRIARPSRLEEPAIYRWLVAATRRAQSIRRGDT
jgi:hypothetical protein